jgi:hypothetical protein
MATSLPTLPPTLKTNHADSAEKRPSGRDFDMLDIVYRKAVNADEDIRQNRRSKNPIILSADTKCRWG